jgi:hypothetical protein
MSYAFYKDAKDGDTVTLENGVRYVYEADKQRWVTKEIVDASACPKFEAVCLAYPDLKSTVEQVVITYYPDAPQGSYTGWSEIKLYNFPAELDASKKWISINGNRHKFKKTTMVGGNPFYEMHHDEGDLSHYEGQNVVVHNCGDDERLDNKNFVMQLRGNFEFDDDGKGIIPLESYYNPDSDPDSVPDPISGWSNYCQYPGVWFYDSDRNNGTYKPQTITHLLINSARLNERNKPDGSAVAGWTDFVQNFEVGDTVQVRTFAAQGFHGTNASGSVDLDSIAGAYFNNLWRITELVEVVDTLDDWGTWGYYCFAVEKVDDDRFYEESIWVTPDADRNEGFYPCEVINNPIVTQDEFTKLQNDIIELEEEIDAIAPSVERGTWKFNLGGVVGSRGQLTMYDGMNGTGSPIGLFKSVKSVWLNELDNDGTPHGFSNVNAGDLIELFVQGEADYGLFTVVEVHDESQGAAQYWVIDVDFVRALNADSKTDNADNLRVKIIQPPSAEGESDDRYLNNGGETTLRSTTTILAGSAGKWMNFQAADDSGTGFFVFRDHTGDNILQVRGSGEVRLKEGRMPTHIDEITTKRYVDSKVGGGNNPLIKYPMTVAWKSGVEETHTMKAENQLSKWSNSSFGGHSAEVFKNLFQWFPPEEYEFIPGNIIWFEKKVSGGRTWEVQPPHAVLAWHATNVIEFTSVRQHLQGHSSWAGFGINDSQPDRDNLAYEVIFQCFRRRG